jgi:phage portal protein BeeE
MYRVPLHLINDLDRATFSNIEHQDLGYLQRSLLPWMLRFDQGFMRGLMTPTERRPVLHEHETGSFSAATRSRAMRRIHWSSTPHPHAERGAGKGKHEPLLRAATRCGSR